MIRDGSGSDQWARQEHAVTARRVLPQLCARVIFLDIDETITTTSGYRGDETFLSSLVKLVAHANGLSMDTAHARILATFDPDNETVDAHYAALGITPRQLWDALMQWMPGAITPFADAVETIPLLHQRGFRLFTGTTNSNLVCRIKLAVAGLGGFEGSSHFERLLGGAEVHPQGKSTPAFYENLLKIAGVRADEVVHVGDDSEADLKLAREAGIRQVVLPRRTQAAEWVQESDGGIYVKSLAILPRIIVLQPRDA